ncbi:MAG: hypothetical protein LC676_06580 [Loktanella sp.]|nr:hypothetical protein [Loktanella sp.]
MTFHINRHYFTGSGRIWDRQTGLAAVVRAMAQHMAKEAVDALTVGSMTDNTGGTAQTTFMRIPMNFAPFDSSSGGGANDAETNTALAALADAHAVLAEHVELVRPTLGLEPVSLGAGHGGNIATSGTVPALTLSVADSQGTASVERKSTLAALDKVAQNQGVLAKAVNEARAAVGLPTDLGGLPFGGEPAYVLEAIGSVNAKAAEEWSIADEDVSGALEIAADNMATMAALFDEAITAAGTAGALPVVAADV